MAEVAAAIAVVDKGLDAGTKTLQLWDEIQNRLIPWKTFDEAVKTLKQYEHDYSTEAGKIVGEITTLLLNSQDQYASSVRDVCDWCRRVSASLNLYLDLFDNYNKDNAEDQKKIIVRVLQTGVDKMTSARVQLEKSSMSFNEAAGKLSDLNTMLKHDFDKGSDYYTYQIDKIRKEAYGGAAVGVVGGPFGLLISYAIAAGVVEGQLIPALNAQLEKVKASYTNLQEIVEKARSDIEDVKHKLAKEIDDIREMKAKTEDTQEVFELKQSHADKLKASAKTLIDAADAYLGRHEHAKW